MKKIAITTLVLFSMALAGCKKTENKSEFIKNTGKVAYILTGYGEKFSDKVYQRLSGYFSDRGIEPRNVEVYNEEGFEKYIEDLIAEIQSQSESSTDEIYLFGVSIGAAGVLNAVPVIKPKVAIIASPAILFEENRVEAKSMSWYSKAFIMSKMLHHEDRPLPKLSEVIDNIKKESPSTRIIVMSGSKDMDMVKSNATAIADSIRGSTYIMVPDAGDRLADSSYIEMVRGVVESL